MVERRAARAALAHETQGGREDRAAALPRLHRACGEALALADVLDGVYDGDVGVAGKDEVAVHGVDEEGGGDGFLGGGEALRDDGAAVDAAGAGRMPEGAEVREEVGGDVIQGTEFKGGFDAREVWVGGGWAEEGRHVVTAMRWLLD